MTPAKGTDEEIARAVSRIEVMSDANKLQNIFSAVHSGYELACQV
jgi:hypothetical protein